LFFIFAKKYFCFLLSIWWEFLKFYICQEKKKTFLVDMSELFLSHRNQKGFNFRFFGLGKTAKGKLFGFGGKKFFWKINFFPPSKNNPKITQKQPKNKNKK